MLFNAKAIILEEQQWWEDKRVHAFSKGICPKVNVIARLEFELAVQRFNHYNTWTPRMHIYIYIYISSYSSSSSSSCRISLTLSRHFSLLFIASCRSSGLHPVSTHSCCMYVRAGRPALARPYVGVHRSTSFMSSSLLLQQCPACLLRLTWMVFVMGGRWLCGALLPWLIQYSSQHSCVITV